MMRFFFLALDPSRILPEPIANGGVERVVAWLLSPALLGGEAVSVMELWGEMTGRGLKQAGGSVLEMERKTSPPAGMPAGLFFRADCTCLFSGSLLEVAVVSKVDPSSKLMDRLAWLPLAVLANPGTSASLEVRR